MALGGKKENSPWGAADFTVEEAPSSTSSYNWDAPSGGGADFFSQAASDNKKVHILTSQS